MTRELDSLLARLRAVAPPARMLQDVELELWQRIAALERRPAGRSLRLTVQLAAILAAFGLGVLIGDGGLVQAGSTGSPQVFLADDADALPPNAGSLLF